MTRDEATRALLDVMNANAEAEAYSRDEGLGLYMSMENAGRGISYAQSDGHKYYKKGVPFFLQNLAPITLDKLGLGDWHYELRPTMKTRWEMWRHPEKALERQERIEAAERAYARTEQAYNDYNAKEKKDEHH